LRSPSLAGAGEKLSRTKKMAVRMQPEYLNISDHVT